MNKRRGDVTVKPILTEKTGAGLYVFFNISMPEVRDKDHLSKIAKVSLPALKLREN
jgi:hypothetical protein